MNGNFNNLSYFHTNLGDQGSERHSFFIFYLLWWLPCMTENMFTKSVTSRLGLLEKEYIRAGNEGLVSPLTRFLDGEMRNIMRERKILENKRLDLDACKNRVRKARSMLDQTPVRKIRCLMTSVINNNITWWLIWRSFINSLFTEGWDWSETSFGTGK